MQSTITWTEAWSTPKLTHQPENLRNRAHKRFTRQARRKAKKLKQTKTSWCMNFPQKPTRAATLRQHASPRQTWRVINRHRKYNAATWSRAVNRQPGDRPGDFKAGPSVQANRQTNFPSFLIFSYFPIYDLENPENPEFSHCFPEISEFPIFPWNRETVKSHNPWNRLPDFSDFPIFRFVI